MAARVSPSMSFHARFVVPTVVALASCGRGPDGFDVLQQELDLHRSQWQEAGIDGYGMRESLSCLCVLPLQGEVDLQVRDGVVVSATYVESGEAVDSQYVESFLTVEEIFDYIQESILHRPAFMRAEYDPDLGYPVDVYVDSLASVGDDEFGIRVLDLQAASLPSVHAERGRPFFVPVPPLSLAVPMSPNPEVEGP